MSEDPKNGKIDWHNRKQVLQVLLLLYRYQTSDEIATMMTRHQNGVGFNTADSTWCSSIAHQVLEGKPVSEKVFGILQKILPKYQGQFDKEDIEIIPIQQSALVIFESSGLAKPDGLIDIENGKLVFTPYVFPSSQIHQAGSFTWGGTYDKRWYGTKPANLETLYAIEKMFQNSRRSPEVDEFETKKLSLSDLPEFVTGSTLFDKQKQATQFCVDHERVLIAMAPGTGKSAVAAMASKVVDVKRVLIICPLSLTRNWRNELKKWIHIDATIWHGNVATWEYAPSGYVITNYNTIVNNEEDIIKCGFELIAVDESILVKNHKRKQERKDDDSRGRWYFLTERVEAIFQVTRNARYTWLLSGSPTSKYYDDLWSQLHIIDPKRFSSYWAFVDRYCITEPNPWSPHSKTVIGNMPDAAERLHRDLADVLFYCTQDQVLDLPPFIFDDVEIEMDAEQTRLYNEMENQFIAYLDDGDDISAPIVLTQLLRLVQFVSNPILAQNNAPDLHPKWNAIIDMLQFEQLPALVWTTFIETAQRMKSLCEASGYRVAALTGQTPERERQGIVDNFQAGKYDLVIAHPGVGKFGFTLTAGRTAFYLERGYNADDYYQSLYRVRRIGTTYSPHMIHLLAVKPNGDPTVDHVIHEILKSRTDNSIALTGGEIRRLFGKVVS